MGRKPSERQYIKSGRKVTSGLAVVIAIAVFVAAFGCAAMFFGANYTISRVQASSGVIVQMNVYGNDVVVDIVEGSRVADLEYIYLIIDGYEMPDSVAGKAVAGGVAKIVYPGIAFGISGLHQVGVRGYFKDGTTFLLAHKEMRFT
ncbi:MAG: hypothetical protein Q4Q04_04815 [Methanocorpusculum sp.]|nr:hypothetical protein [Methanocorpusculum sp.]